MKPTKTIGTHDGTNLARLYTINNALDERESSLQMEIVISRNNRPLILYN